MDFSGVDIPEILFAAIPQRFQDFSPTDFEDFMAQLFRDMGFIVEQTKYSGDFGADLLTSKESERAVVQVKRYAEDSKVGVADVNQVLGAKDYYDADVAIMVTTSSLTRQAQKLCEKAHVSVWDWDKLQAALFTTYFDNLDYFSFFEERLKANSMETGSLGVESLGEVRLKDIFEFRFVEYVTGETVGRHPGEEVIAILVEATNVSKENLHLQILLPDYVTHDHRQISVHGVWDIHFFSGTVFANTKVKMGFFFLTKLLPKITVGDKIVLQLSVDSGYIIRHFMEVTSLEGVKHTHSGAGKSSGACFVATALFGYGSPEYAELTRLRDCVLKNHALGRGFIDWYYQSGPWFVRQLERCDALRTIAHLFIRVLVIPVRLINRHYA